MNVDLRHPQCSPSSTCHPPAGLPHGAAARGSPWSFATDVYGSRPVSPLAYAPAQTISPKSISPRLSRAASHSLTPRATSPVACAPQRSVVASQARSAHGLWVHASVPATEVPPQPFEPPQTAPPAPAAYTQTSRKVVLGSSQNGRLERPHFASSVPLPNPLPAPATVGLYTSSSMSMTVAESAGCAAESQRHRSPEIARANAEPPKGAVTALTAPALRLANLSLLNDNEESRPDSARSAPAVVCSGLRSNAEFSDVPSVQGVSPRSDGDTEGVQVVQCQPPQHRAVA